MDKMSKIHWQHSHNFESNSEKKLSKVKLVFWLTTVVMIVEIVAGTIFGSMALLADGWHMGTHSAAFAITIFAYIYATKHANNKAYSFGTGKVNYLGGFASAVALAIVALMMAIESIQRLVEPHSIRFDEAIMVAIVGLVVNVASVFVLHDDHHHHEHEHKDHNLEQQKSHKQVHKTHHHDHNMKAAYFHVLADTLTSVLAIVALLSGKYFGWIWMDAMMGIVGAMVISHWAYGLIKQSSAVLLDKSSGISLDQIAKTISQKTQSTVTDLHIWTIASGHRAAILAVQSDSAISIDEYKRHLKDILPNLAHISVEIDNQ